jgi:GNAT superfamily N-acetyltransferase
MRTIVRLLGEADPADLVGLLRARHDRHRAAEPLLAVVEAEAEIVDLLGRERLSGAVAVSGGETVGFLLGQVRENQSWGRHLWVDYAAHAAAASELLRDLYAASAPAWIEAGARLHLAMVPATAEQLDPWYRLGFGQMQVEGIREAGADPRPLPDGVTIRLGGPDDLERVAREHGLLIWEHQQLAPTFTGLAAPEWELLLADWLETFADPSDTLFLAERDGELLGSLLYYRPPRALGMPDDAVRLATAAVVPHARGQGIGMALAEMSFAWARGAGYGSVVTDWRAPNLLSSRFWPSRGFRPTFHRLHRMIGTG